MILFDVPTVGTKLNLYLTLDKHISGLHSALSTKALSEIMLEFSMSIAYLPIKLNVTKSNLYPSLIWFLLVQQSLKKNVFNFLNMSHLFTSFTSCGKLLNNIREDFSKG